MKIYVPGFGGPVIRVLPLVLRFRELCHQCKPVVLGSTSITSLEALQARGETAGVRTSDLPRWKEVWLPPAQRAARLFGGMAGQHLLSLPGELMALPEAFPRQRPEPFAVPRPCAPHRQN